MHTIGVRKIRGQVAVLVSPELWRDNHDDATEYAIEQALDYFQGKGVLLPETFTVHEFEPGKWDNHSPELNLPNNHNALMVFNGEVVSG